MHPFRLAVENHDVSSIEGMLAPDVKLHSPIPFRPFEGAETVLGVLHGLSAVTEELEYTEEFTNDDAVALISRVKIGGRDGEALQLLRFDSDGKITSITDMLRPQSAVQALSDAMKAHLAAVADGHSDK
jgi:hypothetical protein